MAGQILGQDVAQDMLSSALRLVVSQRLVPNPSSKTQWDRLMIDGDVAWSNSFQSELAQTIRKGEWARINNIVAAQKNRMDEGMRNKTSPTDMMTLLSNEVNKTK